MSTLDKLSMAPGMPMVRERPEHLSEDFPDPEVFPEVRTPPTLLYAELSKYNGLSYVRQPNSPPPPGIFPSWDQFDLYDGISQPTSPTQAAGSYMIDIKTEHEPKEPELNSTSDVEMSFRPENELIEHDYTKLPPSVSAPIAKLRNPSTPKRKSAKKKPLPYHRVKRKTTERLPKKHNLDVEEHIEEPTDHDKDEAPPKLKADCPDEPRCLIQSRWRHRHRRGKTMWDYIRQDLQKTFGKDYSKGELQMKLSRARCKYIQWDDKDLHILHDVWVSMERDRYEIIRRRFFEMGGSTNMLLSSSDIEYVIVNELKLEENLIVDKLGEVETRRRFRVPKKGPVCRVLSDDAERRVSPDDLLKQSKGRKRPAASPDA